MVSFGLINLFLFLFSFVSLTFRVSYFYFSTSFVLSFISLFYGLCCTTGRLSTRCWSAAANFLPSSDFLFSSPLCRCCELKGTFQFQLSAFHKSLYLIHSRLQSSAILKSPKVSHFFLFFLLIYRFYDVRIFCCFSNELFFFFG